MRKHGILILMIVLVLSLVLTGCGKSAESETTASPFEGKWIATEAELNGIAVDVRDIAGNLNITLEADGKAVARMDDLTEKGSWEASEDGNGVTVYLTDMDFVFRPKEDGVMTVEYENIVFTFEKEEEEAFSTEALSDSAE